MRLVKNYVIDSRKRKSYENSNNFKIRLNENVDKFTNICLKYFSIPLTFYNVTQGYNKIDFNDGVLRTATLPDGNYNTTDLQTEIKTQMEAVSPNTFTVVYNPKTFKFTISCSGTFSLLFKTGPNNTDNFNRLIGFTNNDFPTAASQVSDIVIDLNIKNKYIRVEVSELGDIGKTEINSYFTFIIPVKQNRSDINIFESNTDFNQKLNESFDFHKLTIRLRDDDGNLLDINNADWYMILEVS